MQRILAIVTVLFVLSAVSACRSLKPRIDPTIVNDGKAALEIVQLRAGDAVIFHSPRTDIVPGVTITNIVLDTPWYLLSDDVYFDIVGQEE